MKRFTSSVFLCIAALLAAFVVASCASSPKLGTPTLIQQLLNELPAVSVAGKNLKFEFGGDVWIAKVDGKGFLAGTFQFAETADGGTLTLKQTHMYSTEQKPGVGGEVGWVKTPGPDIVLEYKKGPPETLGVK